MTSAAPTTAPDSPMHGVRCPECGTPATPPTQEERRRMHSPWLAHLIVLAAVAAMLGATAWSINSQLAAGRGGTGTSVLQLSVKGERTIGEWIADLEDGSIKPLALSNLAEAVRRAGTASAPSRDFLTIQVLNDRIWKYEEFTLGWLSPWFYHSTSTAPPGESTFSMSTAVWDLAFGTLTRRQDPNFTSISLTSLALPAVLMIIVMLALMAFLRLLGIVMGRKLFSRRVEKPIIGFIFIALTLLVFFWPGRRVESTRGEERPVALCDGHGDSPLILRPELENIESDAAAQHKLVGVLRANLTEASETPRYLGFGLIMEHSCATMVRAGLPHTWFSYAAGPIIMPEPERFSWHWRRGDLTAYGADSRDIYMWWVYPSGIALSICLLLNVFYITRAVQWAVVRWRVNQRLRRSLCVTCGYELPRAPAPTPSSRASHP